MLSQIDLKFPDKSNKNLSYLEKRESKKKSKPVLEDEDNAFLEGLLHQHNYNSELSDNEEEAIAIDLLESIYELVNSKELPNKKIIDILALLNGALKVLQKPYLIEKIIQIHQNILSYHSLTQDSYKQFFKNISRIFIHIKDSEKSEYKHKFILLIEYFLMKNQDHMTSSHIRLFLKIINQQILNPDKQIIFPFAFLFLKIFEIIKKKSLRHTFQVDLILTKENLLEKVPDSAEGENLRKLITNTNI